MAEINKLPVKARTMSEIKPTWKLAWGLLWRTWLIVLGIYGLIGIGYLIIFGLTLLLK